MNARGWLNLALANVAEQIASAPEMKTSEKHPLTPKNLTSSRVVFAATIPDPRAPCVWP